MKDSTKKSEDLETKISHLAQKVNQQEEKILFLTQQLDFAMNNIKSNDPHGALNKSRIILEKIIFSVFEKEMGHQSNHDDLYKTMCNKQFQDKIERRIWARMNGVKDMSNLGTHGENVNIDDATSVLESLSIIIEWYFDNYTDRKYLNEIDENEKKFDEKIAESQLDRICKQAIIELEEKIQKEINQIKSKYDLEKIQLMLIAGDPDANLIIDQMTKELSDVSNKYSGDIENLYKKIEDDCKSELKKYKK